MQQRRIMFVSAALTLVAVSLAVVSVRGQGTPTYKNVLALDFSKADDQGKMTLNGNAYFADKTATLHPPASPRLRITDVGGQNNSAYLTAPMGFTTNYRVLFNFEVQSNSGATPGDGFAFVVQSVGNTEVGSEAGGSSMGYVTADFNPDKAAGYNRGAGVLSFVNPAVEFNAWTGNGLKDTPQTIALDILGLRPRFNQTPFSFVDGGVFTAQIDVSPDQILATMTGGNLGAGKSFAFAGPAIKGFFADPLDASGNPVPLFFGFSGGTGGANETAEILNMAIQVPA